MTWKRLVVLAAAAVLVIGGVVGLGRLLVPDEPTFAEDLGEATQDPEGGLDIVPNAIGAQLDITGDREGTMDMTREDASSGPGFGLAGDDGKIFFTESAPLAVAQLYFKDLAFFLDPEECGLTEGQYNEDAGLVAVQIICPELVDIRDNGTVSVEGHAALPADMVREDIPRLGGTVMMGNSEWTVGPSTLFLGGSFDEEDTGLRVGSVDSHQRTFWFSYNIETEELSLTRMERFDGTEVENREIDPGACEVNNEELMTVSPERKIVEMEFNCDRGAIPGTAPISGTMVFDVVDLDGG